MPENLNNTSNINNTNFLTQIINHFDESPNGFVDPFGETTMSTPEHIIEENLSLTKVNKGRTAKVKRNKFFISKELKKRLKTLLDSSDNDDVKKIAEAILKLKYEPESGYNYLGLSDSDFTKISYLDNVRIEKFKNVVNKSFILDRTTKMYHRYVSWNGDTNYKKINLYTRNFRFNPELEIVHVSEVAKTMEEQNDPNFNSKKTYWHVSSYFAAKQNSFELNNESYEDIENYYLKIKKSNLSRFLSHMEVLGTYGRRYSLYNSRSVRFGIDNAEFAHINAMDNPPDCEYILFTIVKNHYNLFISPTERVVSKLWDPSIRYHTKIGKIVRKIFPNIYNDNEITNFSEEYRKLIVVDKDGFDYKEVSGQDIVFWYNQENAYDSGTLGSSCMRYAKCGSYFKIYTENPNVKLAIILHKNRVKARCLLWKIDNVTYYDRIYYTDNDTKYMLENILNSQNYKNCYNPPNGLGEITIPISEKTLVSYGQYPYIDTFRYYDIERECLTNVEVSGKHYAFCNTHGDFDDNSEATEECYECGSYFPLDELREIDAGRCSNHYACGECTILTHAGENILYTEHVETIDNLIEHIHDAILLYDNQYATHQNDQVCQYEVGNHFSFTSSRYFHLIYHEYNELDGLYYHPEDSLYYELIDERERELKIEENEQNQENQENNLKETTNELL
jgi:hypothetical protein